MYLSLTRSSREIKKKLIFFWMIKNYVMETKEKSFEISNFHIQ